MGYIQIARPMRSPLNLTKLEYIFKEYHEQNVLVDTLWYTPISHEDRIEVHGWWTQFCWMCKKHHKLIHLYINLEDISNAPYMIKDVHRVYIPAFSFEEHKKIAKDMDNYKVIYVIRNINSTTLDFPKLDEYIHCQIPVEVMVIPSLDYIEKGDEYFNTLSVGPRIFMQKYSNYIEAGRRVIFDGQLSKIGDYVIPDYCLSGELPHPEVV